MFSCKHQGCWLLAGQAHRIATLLSLQIQVRWRVVRCLSSVGEAGYWGHPWVIQNDRKIWKTREASQKNYFQKETEAKYCRYCT